MADAKQKINANGNIIRYSVQRVMLLKLYKNNMISEKEYKKIKEQLMADYKILSDLTA